MISLKKLTIMFTLFLVFVFSTNVFSASLYEDLINTSDIDYEQGEGEIEYILVPIQYISNYRINGFDQQLKIEYAAGKNILLKGSFDSIYPFDINGEIYNAGIKYKFFERDSYTMAMETDYTDLRVDENNFTFLESRDLSFSLLTDYYFNDNLTIHNNLKIGIVEGSDDKKKELIGGLSYKIDKYSKFRFSFEGYTDNYLSNLDYLLKTAYQRRFSDKYIYTAACNYAFETSDFSLTNKISYFYNEDLTFEALYTEESGIYGNDDICLKFEEEMKEDLTLTGQYQREFGETPKSDIKTGFIYRF